MVSKEQIAHELTMVYMNNIYGINVSGYFNFSDGDGIGTVETSHFPDVSEISYSKVKTGEKGFLGIEKKKKIPSGCQVDPLFSEMVENYYGAYNKFLDLLSSKP